MNYMEACEKNFKICEEIIRLMNENEISVSQAHAILDYTKNKIARDTKVGDVILLDREDL